jgi:hypothetical protein
MWRAADMDLVKFMVSATSENKLYEEAWCSGSKLLREYGLMMRKEHHIDVSLPHHTRYRLIALLL